MGKKNYFCQLSLIMIFSITIMRVLFFLLLSLMRHITLVDSSKLIIARAQEDTLTSPENMLPNDLVLLGGTSDINQLKETSWTTENSNGEPGLLRQISIDDLPIASSANADCNSGAENSPDHLFKPRPRSARRRLPGCQKIKYFCPLPPETSPATPQPQQQQLQREEEGSESTPSSPNFPKIPDIIIPGTIEPGRERPIRKSNPLSEKNTLMFLYMYPGIDGESNSAVCNKHRNHKVPICAPYLASRLSPADIVKPCRFCEFFFHLIHSLLLLSTLDN